jgi:hypothetical protein
MSDANDITQIHRQSSFLVHDPSKPTGMIFSVDYNQRDKQPYHLTRFDAAGWHDLDSFGTWEAAQVRLQAELNHYDPTWVKRYTPPERPGIAGNQSSAGPPHRQPEQKPDRPSRHIDRPTRDKPQREQDKREQLHDPNTGGASDRPERRSQRIEPERASSKQVFQAEDGGRISGKPMDLAESLKARREADRLGWSDVARDYDVQFRQQWTSFRHRGDVAFWKDMGERTAISAAGAVGGMAGGALAGAAAAGVGLSGLAEAAVVGGVSGMADSAASSGTEMGFGHRMSASAFGTRVVIGGIFGSVIGGIGGKLLGRKPPPEPAPVPPPGEPVLIFRWSSRASLNPQEPFYGPSQEFYGPYHHAKMHSTTPQQIVDSGVLIGGPRGSGYGLGRPTANAFRGELPADTEGVEFFTRTRPNTSTYMQTHANQGASWTLDLQGVTSETRYLERKGYEGDHEHAVVDIFVTRYTVRNKVTGRLEMRLGPYRPEPQRY